MYVIKYDDGTWNVDDGFQCNRKIEATRYHSEEEAEEAAEGFYGVEAIEEISDEEIWAAESERSNDTKVKEAIKYIDSLPWEDAEFDDRTNYDILKVILKSNSYDEFGEDFKDIATWLKRQ